MLWWYWKKSSSKKYPHYSDGKLFCWHTLAGQLMWLDLLLGDLFHSRLRARSLFHSSLMYKTALLFKKLFPIFFLSWRYWNQNKPAPILFVMFLERWKGHSEKDPPPLAHVSLYIKYRNKFTCLVVSVSSSSTAVRCRAPSSLSYSSRQVER